MNGILEQILAALLRIEAQGSAGGASGAAPTQLAPAPLQPVLAAPPATITDAVIMDLIQPHLGNAAIKEQLGVAMRAMGINALPDTQAHQYPELYARFQTIIASGGVVAAVPAHLATSII